SSDHGLRRMLTTPSTDEMKVQDITQQYLISAPGISAIARVNADQHDAASARRRVHHGRALGDLVAALDQAGDEQVLAVGVTENHARPEGWRNHAETVAFLFEIGRASCRERV